MVTITYDYTFPYRILPPVWRHFPAIPVRLITNFGAVDTLAILDSGAERSLFDGAYSQSLGLMLPTGQRISLTGISGTIYGRLHPVEVDIEGHRFTCEICFSEHPISRNLLGRDLFDHIQVGFREHYFELYLTPTP